MLLTIIFAITSGTGNAYPSGAPDFTPGFKWVRVTQSLINVWCFVIHISKPFFVTLQKNKILQSCMTGLRLFQF